MSIYFTETVVDEKGNYEIDEKGNYIPKTTADGDFSEKPRISLTNVPVHRNWRTNILGGLAWIKDPTDPDPDPEDPDEPTPPDGPDDPTSVFKFTNILVSEDPLFFGDYNTEDRGNNNTWFQNPDSPVSPPKWPTVD